MFNSLRSRLWLTYALVIGGMLFISGIVLALYVLRSPLLYTSTVQRLKDIALFFTTLQRFREQGSAGDIETRAYLQRLDEAYDVRLAILDAEGEVLLDSLAGSGSNIPTIHLPAINQDLPRLPVFRDNTGKIWLYSVRSIDDAQWLLVATPRPRLAFSNIFRNELFQPLFRAGLLGLFLALLLAIWIARWVTAPIQRVVTATRSVAAGHFQQIAVEGPAEIQALAWSFNEMTERLQASQLAQRDLVANVSHELKTPLTSIQGYAQAILDGTVNNSESLQQAGNVIHDEASRMSHLVNDLLELARYDSGSVTLEQRPVEITALLSDVLEKFSPIAQQAQIDLHTDLPSLPMLVGDQDRLRQVFSNLVDNALKYTPPGGKVVLCATATAEWLEFQVSDTGPGIPGEDLNRIFERFYQADKARRGGQSRGVGLGLAIAREIVQSHGGTLTVLNNNMVDPNAKGSTFVVQLPILPVADLSLSKQK